jgi:hypothetical protein
MRPLRYPHVLHIRVDQQMVDSVAAALRPGEDRVAFCREAIATLVEKRLAAAASAIPEQPT